MKKNLLTFLAMAGVLAITGHFFAKPLLAAVAALTKNIDERGRNPYIQQVSCYSPSTNQCTAFFPAVPTGMRLVVEHVNLSLDTGSALSHVDIAGNGAIIETPLLQLQGTDAAGNNIYVGNQPFLTYYEAGQTPNVSMFSQSAGFEFMSGAVTLTGYLINLSE